MYRHASALKVGYVCAVCTSIQESCSRITSVRLLYSLSSILVLTRAQPATFSDIQRERINLDSRRRRRCLSSLLKLTNSNISCIRIDDYVDSTVLFRIFFRLTWGADEGVEGAGWSSSRADNVSRSLAVLSLLFLSTSSHSSSSTLMF